MIRVTFEAADMDELRGLVQAFAATIYLDGRARVSTKRRSTRTQAELSQQYGVSQTRISLIRSRKAYRDVF
jgi:hypothetical protein